VLPEGVLRRMVSIDDDDGTDDETACELGVLETLALDELECGLRPLLGEGVFMTLLDRTEGLLDGEPRVFFRPEGGDAGLEDALRLVGDARDTTPADSG